MLVLRESPWLLILPYWPNNFRKLMGTYGDRYCLVLWVMFGDGDTWTVINILKFIWSFYTYTGWGLIFIHLIPFELMESGCNFSGVKNIQNRKSRLWVYVKFCFRYQLNSCNWRKRIDLKQLNIFYLLVLILPEI